MTHLVSWRQVLLSYWDRRLLAIFLLACSSGFPWSLIGSSMSGWLTDAGLTRSTIGFFGSVFSVYAINFLWAPMIDRLTPPLLGRWLGSRRSWIFACQGIIVLATWQLSRLEPQHQLITMSLFALIIACASATQDIAIDAYRIDSFAKHEEHKLPQASAIAVIGWWTGYSLPGYLAFVTADQVGWQNVYLELTAVGVLLATMTLLVKEPITQRAELQQDAEHHYQQAQSRVVRWLLVSFVEPFRDFFARNGVKVALTLLLFVFLFKIGEAFLGRMSITFYRDIGFSNEQIADYSKLIGWGSTVLFTLIGSAVNVRFGVVKGLMIGGGAMAASNLMFAVIAQVGPDPHWLLATILIDNFTTAFSTIAFVSFLTVLTGQAFSATQYALLASLGNLSRTTLASFSGQLVDYLDSWSVFFTLTAVMIVPSLLMLYFLRHFFKKLLVKPRS
ncbi:MULTISPECIES: MFS transporter [unclassified Vibrio]|uniref:MFS transporter n=1 Tax=Vibrio sp. HB236076 TaxID=3232307 RepID=A0AB39HD27_9VIBR|nr:MFS transporter [Vibrio sp. HB161653]MDP5254892.1 MFS transporter [Vibrio sp. HB161653]